MYPPIYKVASADALVTALLGAEPRLYPFGQAPQQVTYPYAVWQVISGSPENYLAGRPDADGYGLQVDVYARDAATARSVADALQHAIELSAYVVSYGGESRDSTTGNYRSTFDVDWIVSR